MFWVSSNISHHFALFISPSPLRLSTALTQYRVLPVSESHQCLARSGSAWRGTGPYRSRQRGEESLPTIHPSSLTSHNIIIIQSPPASGQPTRVPLDASQRANYDCVFCACTVCLFDCLFVSHSAPLPSSLWRASTNPPLFIHSL